MRPPVLLGLRRDPLVEDRVGILTVVEEVVEPDLVVQPRCRPGHAADVEAEDAADLVDAVMPVAEADDLGARLAGHQRAALVDRVARLDQPGVGADALDILRDAEHKCQLPAPADMDAAVVVAVFGGQLAHGALGVVAGDRSSVDHEVGIAQRDGALGRALEAKIRAELAGVAPRQLLDHVEPLGVDIHKADLAARQSWPQAQILDEPERELRAPGADHADFDCSWHGLFLENCR